MSLIFISCTKQDSVFFNMLAKISIFLIVFFVLLSLPLGLLDLLSGGRWTFYSDALRPRLINLFVTMFATRSQKTWLVGSIFFHLLSLPFIVVWWVWDKLLMFALRAFRTSAGRLHSKAKAEFEAELAKVAAAKATGEEVPILPGGEVTLSSLVFDPEADPNCFQNKSPGFKIWCDRAWISDEEKEACKAQGFVIMTTRDGKAKYAMN